MKIFAVTALAGVLVAGAAAAYQMNAHSRGGRGWDSDPGVVVDVPWSAINSSDNSGIPPRSAYEMHCRDARHICFDQWGVDEPGYGRCMTRRGC